MNEGSEDDINFVDSKRSRIDSEYDANSAVDGFEWPYCCSWEEFGTPLDVDPPEEDLSYTFVRINEEPEIGENMQNVEFLQWAVDRYTYNFGHEDETSGGESEDDSGGESEEDSGEESEEDSGEEILDQSRNHRGI